MSSKMRDIPFTQFLLPHGRRRATEIRRPKRIHDLAMPCIMRGARFTVEMLQTGVVSLACEYGDTDISIKLGNNGPEILSKVDELIEESYDLIFKQPSNLKPQL